MVVIVRTRLFEDVFTSTRAIPAAVTTPSAVTFQSPLLLARITVCTSCRGGPGGAR